MRQSTLRCILAIIATTLVILSAGCGGSGGPAQMPTRSDVSGAELQAMMADGEPLVIVDVRTESEYAAGHIPGSVNIPLADLGQRIGELNRTIRTACVCSGGFRSNLAADMLVQAGVIRVYNLLGGLQGWTGAWETP